MSAKRTNFTKNKFSPVKDNESAAPKDTENNMVEIKTMETSGGHDVKISTVSGEKKKLKAKRENNRTTVADTSKGETSRDVTAWVGQNEESVFVSPERTTCPETHDESLDSMRKRLIKVIDTVNRNRQEYNEKYELLELEEYEDLLPPAFNKNLEEVVINVDTQEPNDRERTLRIVRNMEDHIKAFARENPNHALTKELKTLLMLFDHLVEEMS